MNEVNEYYTKTKPLLTDFSPVSVAAAAAGAKSTRTTRLLLGTYGLIVRLRGKLPWLFIPVLITVSALEILFLKLLLIFCEPGDSALHQRARPIIQELVQQYPFGPESPRFLRRLRTLRRWSHEQEIESFFT